MGRATGVVFDSVYAGKALYHFVTCVVPENPGVFLSSHKILIIHTGGVFGLFDKSSQLLSIMNNNKAEAETPSSVPVSGGKLNDQEEISKQQHQQRGAVSDVQKLSDVIE